MPGFRQTSCEKIGVDPARFIIEYALTGPHRFSEISARRLSYHIQIAEVVMRAFARLSQRHPEWQFLMRPHPSDATAKERINAWAAEMDIAGFTLDTSPFPCDPVCAADVLLCTHSNMGIEAILQGKPVINVAIDEFGGPIFCEGIGPLFEPGDAVLTARTEDEIVSSVEAALLDDATRAQLAAARPATKAKFNYMNDAKATERFCALVLDLIDNGHTLVPPVDRFPEFEHALAQAVPPTAKRVTVLGNAAEYQAQAISLRHPEAAVTCVRSAEDAPESEADAVVLADPVPHSAAAEAALHGAAGLLAKEGALVAAFRCGLRPEVAEALESDSWYPPRKGMDSADFMGEYTRKGVEIVLSRCDFEARTVHAVPFLASEEAENERPDIDGWVVQAQFRTWGPGPVARRNEEAKRRGDAANEAGEALFAKGDIDGAMFQFSRAITAWPKGAVYFNNLGAALYAAGNPEDAWQQFRHALHLDPNSPHIRENIRLAAEHLGKEAEAERVLSLFGEDEAR